MCKLWSILEPSQNKMRKARLAKTEGEKWCIVLEDDNLDIKKELPNNTHPDWLTKTPK